MTLVAWSARRALITWDTKIIIFRIIVYISYLILVVLYERRKRREEVTFARCLLSVYLPPDVVSLLSYQFEVSFQHFGHEEYYNEDKFQVFFFFVSLLSKIKGRTSEGVEKEVPLHTRCCLCSISLTWCARNTAARRRDVGAGHPWSVLLTLVAG